MATENASRFTVTASDIVTANDLLTDMIRTTPVLPCRALSERISGPVHLKCENLQRTGSFKIRGSYVRIHRVKESNDGSSVVAASAGNHAQGVALAARLADLPATVFMPEGASLPKLAATESHGADVRLTGHSVAEALAAANSHAQDTGSIFVHPYDHPDIIAGQGTVGLEVLEQCPDVRTILVPVGGGGLLAGVATAVKERKPNTHIVGVQPSGAAAWPAALAADHPVVLDSLSTMADGIAVPRAGDLPFSIARELVDEIVTVSEESLSHALLFCLERAKQVVEPAGAAPIAALLDDSNRFEPPLVAILSGGNIDPLLLLRILRHGMAEAHRFLRLKLRLPDLPGALAHVLLTLADLGANVLDVQHVRTTSTLEVSQAEVAVQVETRGPTHWAQLLAHLKRTGYAVTEF